MPERGRLALTLTACLLLVACDSPPPAAGTQSVAVAGDRAVTAREDFEHDLAGWEVVDGDWQRRASDTSGVLAQTSTDRVYPVTLWKKQRFGDVDVSVRFRPISGEVDASGGIVFRARDGRDYYVVRANSLEDNFRLYTVVDGKRSQIASTRVEPPALGAWHTLRVAAVGPRIQAYLDDRLLIDHQDATFQAGYVGLWTKADAVTEFDDLVVEGTPLAGE